MQIFATVGASVSPGHISSLVFFGHKLILQRESNLIASRVGRGDDPPLPTREGIELDPGCTSLLKVPVFLSFVIFQRGFQTCILRES